MCIRLPSFLQTLHMVALTLLLGPSETILLPFSIINSIFSSSSCNSPENCSLGTAIVLCGRVPIGEYNLLRSEAVVGMCGNWILAELTADDREPIEKGSACQGLIVGVSYQPSPPLI